MNKFRIASSTLEGSRSSSQAATFSYESCLPSDEIVSGVNAVNPGLIDTQIARDVSGDEQAYGEIAKSVPHRPRRQARGDRLGRAVALQSRRELRGGRLPRLGLAIPRQKD
jgi:NAD(P)-dependent dehydrogenase (short-subunit alcohol dehydrogenase family)